MAFSSSINVERMSPLIVIIMCYVLGRHNIIYFILILFSFIYFSFFVFFVFLFLFLLDNEKTCDHDHMI